MRQKKILILGASILQLPAIEKAVDMGLQVIVLDMNPNAIGFQVPGVFCEVISTIDTDKAIESAKRHHIDGVMTLATDMPMRTVAAIAKTCGLVGISEDTAVKATDKSIMRQVLLQAGVPVPAFYRIENRNEFTAAVNHLHLPFLVKPADSSSSRGIYLVKSKDEAENAYEYAKSFSRNGVVVAEEYMTGPEVSVETLAYEGTVHVIQITDKITTGAPHFVEMGHTQPTKMDCASEIEKIAIKANKAIGIENGPSHTEIIITEEGPKIVEIGARLGGDCITTHLVPLSTGVNMVEACIRIALGEKPDIRPTIHCGSAIRYFHQHAGVIKDIQGIDEAKQIEGIKQISIVHGIGEKITDITDSGSRLGFVIAQGTDSKELSGVIVIEGNDAEMGVERILVFRSHIAVDIELHVVQDTDQRIAQMEDIFAGYVIEILVVQLRDSVHHAVGKIPSLFGQIDGILLAALGFTVVVDQLLLSQNFNDPVGVCRVQIQESGKADQGLTILKPECDEIYGVCARQTIVLDEFCHVLTHLDAHTVEERGKKRVPIDVLATTHACKWALMY